MNSTTAWGLKVVAFGWGHQGDSIGIGVARAQTTRTSSKGGADIQPLQVDEIVGFDDIGNLFEYIDVLKKKNSPLLYSNFFSNYHITTLRSVLLCVPLGIGKALIARDLACATTKARQKDNFYMRNENMYLASGLGKLNEN